jgi:hypothetical protein
VVANTRLLLTFVVSLAAMPALCHAQDMAWSMRVGVGASISSEDTTTVDNGVAAQVKQRVVTSVDATATLTRNLEASVGFMSLIAPVSFERDGSRVDTTGVTLSIVTFGFAVHKELPRDFALFGGVRAVGSSREVAIGSNGLRLVIPGALSIAYDAGIRGFSCRECQGFGWDARLTWILFQPPLGSSDSRLSSPLLLTGGLTYRF